MNDSGVIPILGHPQMRILTQRVHLCIIVFLIFDEQGIMAAFRLWLQIYDSIHLSDGEVAIALN